ncbi:hypothetical protein [Winogradskyella wichelsiae]|uniref:hypothetical protein n=1 Tax=Winogradskyella wichelsiae TaxID=2697007 RepID=UPI003EFB340E
MSGSAMNTVIKNNRRLLPQRAKFKNRLGGYDPHVTTEYDFPSATTKQLKAIGKRLRKERKVRMLKVLILTLMIFFTILFLLIRYSSVLKSSLWF